MEDVCFVHQRGFKQLIEPGDSMNQRSGGYIPLLSPVTGISERTLSPQERLKTAELMSGNWSRPPSGDKDVLHKEQLTHSGSYGGSGWRCRGSGEAHVLCATVLLASLRPPLHMNSSVLLSFYMSTDAHRRSPSCTSSVRAPKRTIIVQSEKPDVNLDSI